MLDPAHLRRLATAASRVAGAFTVSLLAQQAAAAQTAAAQPSAAHVTEGGVAAPGVTLHYTLRGEGEPILVLSGGPGFSSDYMAPVAQELASGYRTVLLDQRGTGRSTLEKLDASTLTLHIVVEDLEILRRHLGLERWTVLGHSWGGMLAMAYAVAHPESVKALVLVCSGGPTREFFEPFGANIEARLLPSDREALDFWHDPAQRQADPRRAAYESLRARTPAYFFARKNAWPFVALLRPEGYTSAVNRLLLTDHRALRALSLARAAEGALRRSARLLRRASEHAVRTVEARPRPAVLKSRCARNPDGGAIRFPAPSTPRACDRARRTWRECWRRDS